MRRNDRNQRNSRTSPRREAGFSLVNLAGVLVAMTLLLIVVLPVLGSARRVAMQSTSTDNLRTIGAAHAVYATEWNGRQLTYAVDDLSTYGGFGNWFYNYAQEHGSGGGWADPGNHPPIYLGWGRSSNDNWLYFYYATVQGANASLVLPINLGWGGVTGYFGSFRFINAAQFNEYFGARFYDEVFYAPADEVVIDAVNGGFEAEDPYWTFADVFESVGAIPAWSSYCMSPAAMFHPDVMRHDDPDDPNANGFVDPFDLPYGFESPSVSQAKYASLKSRVLEHHWLQAPPEPCNPAFNPGTYGPPPGCEPYYFNHGMDSAPQTLFYDGHVDSIRVRDAIADDAQVRSQMNPNWGLWSQDTFWGADGYLIEYGYDEAATSFHILTTDGILGRDVLSQGMAPRETPRRYRPTTGALRNMPRRSPWTGQDTSEPRVTLANE